MLNFHPVCDIIDLTIFIERRQLICQQQVKNPVQVHTLAQDADRWLFLMMTQTQCHLALIAETQSLINQVLQSDND